MPGSLQIDVFNTGYRPVPSASPVWPDGQQATWPATTATLVSGDRDAILVDALTTRAQSKELSDWLLATGKNLTQIYITHGHADHFFGLNTVLETFPEAKAVALPDVVPFVDEQASPEWLQIWERIFPGQLFEKPAVPVALQKPEMVVEGHALIPISFGQSDVSVSSAVHIPDLDTVLAGDIIYNNIHVWTYHSDHERRMAWIETIGEVEKLRPKTIIAGHTDPDAPDNDGSRVLNQTRQYIRDFDEAVAASRSGEEVVSTMTHKYPTFGNPYTLWLGAYTQAYGER
jgi:glyoxylase-like metal-dependent hydrolase (beta-lactamase superfamily II)